MKAKEAYKVGNTNNKYTTQQINYKKYKKLFLAYTTIIFIITIHLPSNIKKYIS